MTITPKDAGSSSSQTLFDKYGGAPVITLIVRDFYKRVMRRPQLRRYFDNVPMESLIKHQVAFVSQAMGKTASEYVGRSMRSAHFGLGITKTSFELVVELLCDAMRSAGVEADDMALIAAVVNRYKNEIVER